MVTLVTGLNERKATLYPATIKAMEGKTMKRYAKKEAHKTLHKQRKHMYSVLSHPYKGNGKELCTVCKLWKLHHIHRVEVVEKSDYDLDYST